MIGAESIGRLGDGKEGERLVDQTRTERVVELYENASGSEQEKLLLVVEGFLGVGPVAQDMIVDDVRGHRAGVSYGDWDDSKDRVQDSLEETRDEANYLMAEIRRLKKQIKGLLPHETFPQVYSLVKRLSMVHSARNAGQLSRRLLMQVKHHESQPVGGE